MVLDTLNGSIVSSEIRRMFDGIQISQFNLFLHLDSRNGWSVGDDHQSLLTTGNLNECRSTRWWDNVILHLHGDKFRAIFPSPGCNEPGQFLLERSWKVFPRAPKTYNRPRDLMHTSLKHTNKNVLQGGNIKFRQQECSKEFTSRMSRKGPQSLRIKCTKEFGISWNEKTWQ